MSTGSGVRVLKRICFSILIVAALASVVVTFVVPFAVDRGVRSRLDRAGFSQARFSVGRVALDRVELLDVSLQRGLHLGDVTIEAGPYQLWRGARPDVIVRGARLDLRAPLPPSGANQAPPFRRLVIEDSELAVN